MEKGIIIEIELFFDLIEYLSKNSNESDDVSPSNPEKVASRLLKDLRKQVERIDRNNHL